MSKYNRSYHLNYFGVVAIVSVTSVAAYLQGHFEAAIAAWVAVTAAESFTDRSVDTGTDRSAGDHSE